METSLLNTRALSARALIEVAWITMSPHMWAIILIALAPDAFSYGLGFVIYTAEQLSPALRHWLTQASDLGWAAVAAAFMLIYLLFNAASFAAIAQIVETEVTGRDRSYLGAVKNAFSRMPALILTGIPSTILLVAAYLLLILPGIALSIYLFFVYHAAALRGVGGIGAISYSKSLVNGRWWELFWLLFRLGLIMGIIGWVIELIPAGLVYDLLSSVFYAFLMVITIILFLELDYQRYPPSVAPDPYPDSQLEPAPALNTSGEGLGMDISPSDNT